jgi:UDP-glucose 4-epimerase
LIIGGADYVGAHSVPYLVPYLVPQLVTMGRRVTILGRSAVPWYELPAGTDYVAGDLAQYDVICRLLDVHQEVIYLTDATVSNASFEKPLVDLLQNLPSTVQLFSNVADRGGRLVLISSGGAVYGEAVELPIRESHPTKPISPYGVTKLTLENYAYLYAATHGLKFVCVRPSNAYGVGQRPFDGQGFIATAIASALRGIPIKIFGQRGTVRDYLFVSDLASGIVSALEHGRLSETYNLGSGVGLSNLDVIEAITPLMREIGCEVRVENLPESTFDIKVNVLDSTKLQTDTGWSAQMEFIEGIAATCDWLQKQKI